MNSPATGRPTISGRVEAGQYLEVSLDDVEDANGVPDKAANVSGWYGVPSAGYGSDFGPGGFATVTTNYRMTWQRVDADGFSNPTEVWNPSTTYKLTPADVGKRIKVRVLFIDNKGSAEEVVSDATPVVVESGRPGAVLTSKSVCSRTPAVRDAIVAAVTGVTDCANVSRSHLRAIRTLTIPAGSLSTSGLRAWDFEGLSGPLALVLSRSGLSALPAGVFDDLTALDSLTLTGNALTALPPGIFDKNTALISLTLAINSLGVGALPEGVFEKLTALSTLTLLGNPGTSTFLPVANAGPDQGSVSASSSVTLSGSATGPWGNNVSFLWKQVTDATGATELTSGAVTLTGATTATPSFTMPATGGPFYFRLTVTGKGGLYTSMSDTVTVTTTSLATTAPSVTGVTILPEFGNGSWEEGETVEAALTFDEAVNLLAVTGGTVQKARRKTTGSNIGWVVTIRPSGSGDIAIRLPARACGEANAVCFDNSPLARDATGGGARRSGRSGRSGRSVHGLVHRGAGRA